MKEEECKQAIINDNTVIMGIKSFNANTHHHHHKAKQIWSDLHIKFSTPHNYLEVVAAIKVWVN